MIKVLFVCLGNICRSPMAEGIFQDLLEKNNLGHQIQCDSAGTSSYHIGELADSRMRQTARKHGIELTSRARQLVKGDFDNFDYIIPMDSSNLTNSQRLAAQLEATGASLYMMRYFDPEAQNADVPDPYYGSGDGFEKVYQILSRSCQNFLDYLRREHNI